MSTSLEDHRDDIAAALRHYSSEQSLAFDDSGGSLEDLGRHLLELGWNQVDLTEATMEIPKELISLWFEDLWDSGVEKPAPDILSLERAFLLVWNPKRFEIADDEYRQLVAVTSQGLLAVGSWSVGSRKFGIAPGDVAYLYRSHDDQGIVASGVFTSEIYEGSAFDDAPGTYRYADIEWDTWLPQEGSLSLAALEAAVPEVAWRRLQGSGVQVPDTSTESLADLWDRHLAALDMLVQDQPGEFVPESTPFPEGAVTTVTVNRYERSRPARQACLEHHGYRCAVCDFDFEAVYGERGANFIHVHHLVPLEEIGGDYVVDPVADLRPVCPNCHAMLHRSRPPATVKELRAEMKDVYG